MEVAVSATSAASILRSLPILRPRLGVEAKRMKAAIEPDSGLFSCGSSDSFPHQSLFITSTGRLRAKSESLKRIAVMAAVGARSENESPEIIILLIVAAGSTDGFRSVDSFYSLPFTRRLSGLEGNTAWSA